MSGKRGLECGVNNKRLITKVLDTNSARITRELARQRYKRALYCALDLYNRLTDAVTTLHQG